MAIVVNLVTVPRLSEGTGSSESGSDWAERNNLVTVPTLLRFPLSRSESGSDWAARSNLVTVPRGTTVAPTGARAMEFVYYAHH
jgi:hypothetical protein